MIFEKLMISAKENPGSSFTHHWYSFIQISKGKYTLFYFPEMLFYSKVIAPLRNYNFAEETNYVLVSSNDLSIFDFSEKDKTFHVLFWIQYKFRYLFVDKLWMSTNIILT